MSRVISQGPCPNPSHLHGDRSEAFTTYEDGSAYCFTCGYYIPANKYKALHKTLSQMSMKDQMALANKTVNKKHLPLPEDAVPLIDAPESVHSHQAYNWLLSFDITCAVMEEYNILWSESKGYLIFTVDKGYWTGRYFGPNSKHPKYIAHGNKDLLTIIGKESTGGLVLVEDFVSAIRIAKFTEVIPLYGSILTREQVVQISHLYDKIYLWLDFDKRDYAVQKAVEYSNLIEIKPMITMLDPKAYSDKLIADYLRGVKCID